MASAPTQAVPVKETTDQMLQAYQANLPALMQIYNQQQTPTAQAQLAAQKATQPAYDALNLAEYNKNAPAYANTQAQTNLGLLNGTGSKLASSALALNNKINPLQAANSNAAGNLVNSINLNGLSAGEQNAVERSLNQSNYATGNLGLDNATNVVSNAMNFGNAIQAKREALGQALGTSNMISATNNQQTNPLGIATGNFLGGNQFTNPQLSATTSPTASNTFANNVFGGISSAAQGNADAQNRLNYANSNQGIASSFGANNVFSGGSGGGLAACCFIFMEAYHGNMPKEVRDCRDRYYRLYPQIANGYKKMARWLVPVMQKNKFIRYLVWNSMVKPLTEYGAFIKRYNNNGRKYRIYRKFWFAIWFLLGKENK